MFESVLKYWFEIRASFSRSCVCMYRNVNTQIQLGTAAYGKRLCQWQFLYGSEEIIFLANLWCLRKSQSKDMDVTFSAVCVMIERGILNAFTA